MESQALAILSTCNLEVKEAAALFCQAVLEKELALAEKAHNLSEEDLLGARELMDQAVDELEDAHHKVSEAIPKASEAAMARHEGANAYLQELESEHADVSNGSSADISLSHLERLMADARGEARLAAMGLQVLELETDCLHREVDTQKHKLEMHKKVEQELRLKKRGSIVSKAEANQAEVAQKKAEALQEEALAAVAALEAASASVEALPKTMSKKAPDLQAGP